MIDIVSLELARQDFKKQNEIAAEIIGLPKEIFEVVCTAIDVLFLTVDFNGIEKRNEVTTSLSFKRTFIEFIANNLPRKYNNDAGAKWLLKYERALLSAFLNSDDLTITEKISIAQNVKRICKESQFLYSDINSEFANEFMQSIETYCDSHLTRLINLAGQNNGSKISEMPEHGKVKPESVGLKFQTKLDNPQQTLLIEFFQNYDITNAPVSLAEFLNGKYDGRTQIHIKEDDKQLEIFSYLIYQLKKTGLIKLTTGRNHLEYVARHILPFTKQTQNKQLESFLRKAKRDKSTKPTIVDIVDGLSKRLKSK